MKTLSRLALAVNLHRGGAGLLPSPDQHRGVFLGTTNRLAGWVLLTMVLLSISAGCNRKASSQLSSADQAAFDQAPAEIKAAWVQATEAVKTNGYVTAYNLFYELVSADLSSEQKQAITKASAALNQQLLAAVDKGDPAARDALQEMRRHPPGRKRAE